MMLNTCPNKELSAPNVLRLRLSPCSGSVLMVLMLRRMTEAENQTGNWRWKVKAVKGLMPRGSAEPPARVFSGGEGKVLPGDLLLGSSWLFVF